MRLVVEGLEVRDAAGRVLLSPLDVVLEGGRCLCLLGESGAGKSLVCAAVAGTLPAGLAMRGRIWVDGREVTAMAAGARRLLWSRALFLLPQEPWAALAPARTVLAQVGDMPRLRGVGGSAAALLERVGLRPVPDGGKRPGALSGGMAQRAAMATAMGAAAPLILVDEPTKGLDPLRRAMAEAGLRALLAEGRSVLLVTHDLGLAERLGDEVVVMQDGCVVERGDAASVFGRPVHAFTRALLAADPLAWAARGSTSGGPFLAARGLAVRPARGRAVVASGIDLDLAQGGIVGLCGPSGCGKTTLGDTVIGLLRPAAGTVRRPADAVVQKLYQNPGAAFAPWRTVGATLSDVLGRRPGRDRRPGRAGLAALCRPVLDRLGLGTALLERRPGSVSGGELQRLALARAVLSGAGLIFADEPTSRLDAISQMRFMTLLGEVAGTGCAILLASHDAALVAKTADETVTLGMDVPCG